MNWNDIDKKLLITILACFVGTFVLSILRVQPEGISYALGDVNAYAALGSVGIFASILLLGIPWGVVASVAGMILGDIVMGSTLFIIGNLLIGTGVALLVSAFAVKCNTWVKCFVVAGLAEGIMLVLFLIYDLLIVREFQVVGIAALLQLAQAIVCTAVGAVVLKYVPPMYPEKMLDIRRSPEGR